jgi:hypothetical protein
MKNFGTLSPWRSDNRQENEFASGFLWCWLWEFSQASYVSICLLVWDTGASFGFLDYDVLECNITV